VIYYDKFTALSLKCYVSPILSEIGMQRQIVIENNKYVISRVRPHGHWDRQSI